jgi:hypothetical protein
MDSAQRARVAFDAEQYDRRSRGGPCFVCSILADTRLHPPRRLRRCQHVAFLARWPTLLGHTLVTPKQPYHQQQLPALTADYGVLDVDDNSQAALAVSSPC